MDVREAIARNLSGELGGDTLARILVGHEGWIVPVSLARPEGPTPLARVDGTDRWLQAFTDREALAAWERASGARFEHFLAFSGTGLFEGLEDDAAGLDVDPGSDHAIHYRRDQFSELREMAEAVVVARILGGVHLADGFARLRRYAGYRTVHRVGPDGTPQMVLAPDSRSRRLAAVFTAPDTLRAFLADRASDLGGVPLVTTSKGEDLFRLLSGLPLDGIVFDCAGPVPPRAVAAQFAEAVLAGRDG